MPAVVDLPQEARADGVDEMGGEDAARQEVHLDVVASVLIRGRRAVEVEVHPELRRVDPAIFHLAEGDTLGVDVVDGEEGLDAATPGHGGDEASHPVIAMDEVRVHAGDDVIDDFALEGERYLDGVLGVAGIDLIAVVEDAVLGEVDVIFRQLLVILAQLLFVKLEDVHVEHAPVVRQCHMHVRTEVKQG